MTYHKNSQPGFALLLAIIVVGVVVSIGLSVLDVTLKQVRLSTNSKDSEVVFHTVNAGLECARYVRVNDSDDIEEGNDITPDCFDTSLGTVESDSYSGPEVTNGSLHVYSLETTWGSNSDRCSQMKIIAFEPTLSDIEMTVSADKMEELVPSYPYGAKECGAGGLCTVISVQGYNRDCGNISLDGTIQREVLLEL